MMLPSRGSMLLLQRQQLKRVADTICLIGAHLTLQRSALSVRNLIHFVSAHTLANFGAIVAVATAAVAVAGAVAA